MEAEDVPSELVAVQVYVPASPGPRGDMVRDVEVLVD